MLPHFGENSNFGWRNTQLFLESTIELVSDLLPYFYEIDWFEVWSYWLIFKSNIQWLHFFFPCKNMKNQRNFLPSPFIPLTITKITSVLTLVEVPPSTYIDSGLKLGIWNSGCQSLVNPQNSRVQHNIMYGNCQN